MDKKKVIERVKKLLSLANSDNENEAKLAAANANKLLTKYNLSMQELKVEREYEENVIVEKARMAQEDKWILPILRDFFFVYPLVHSRQTGRKNGRRSFTHSIKFLGEDANVEVATHIYTFLSHEFRVLFSSYRVRTGCPLSSRDSYYHGLVWGLKTQLKTVQTQAQTETGLVLVKDAALENYFNELHPEAKTKNAHANTGDLKAQGQGIEDGKKISLRKNLYDNKQEQGINVAQLAASMLGR